MPRDPYRNFRFEVEIDGFVRAGFMKVSGLEHEVEEIKYREGGDNDTMRKLPGQSDFGDVVLERGQSDDSDFTSWIEEIFRLGDGVNQGEVEGWRRTIVIFLRDKSGARVKKWRVIYAWPKKDESGELDATANSYLIEKLTLANEGIQRETL